jgi:hypothetical protein
MEIVYSIYDLPTAPSVYAMYGGRKQKHIAYVGIGTNLQQRLNQHFIKRDSSVATVTSTAGINPDYVTEVAWWEDSSFNDGDCLEAAELVAFDVLEPALRSRGNTSKKALEIYKDDSFKAKMRSLFEGEPSGKLILPNLEDLYKKLLQLEKRVQRIENEVLKNDGTYKAISGP